MVAKTALSLVAVVVCWAASVQTSAAQAPRPPAKAAPPGAVSGKPLPRMDDWFLSTGNWQTDPQLYVREFGEGSETVVMLHGGWGAEHSGLVTAVKDLGQHYRFIFYDQRGSLRSPSPDALITFDRHVEDLELLRRELQLETMTVVGHSMGAVLASAYASKYPQRIARLILLAPAPLKNPIPDQDKALQRQGAEASNQFVNRSEVAAELARHGLTNTASPLSSRQETSKFRITFAGRMLSQVERWPRLAGGRALFKANVGDLTARTYPASGWDYVEEFKRRSYPIGVIVGEHDFVDFGGGLISKWAAGVPNLEVTIVPKAGHLLWIDQPAGVTAALARQLRRPVGAPRS